MLQESVIFQDILQKAFQEGFQEAFQESFQEAFQEAFEQGKREGASYIILRLLPRLLGSLSHELQARICQLSFDQLEDLAEALLDFSTAEDLVTWLESNPLLAED
ncbi:DUF4351 domain-containing protein [Leptolyngbya sp. FACHB-261]|uniref:DUF4351 domain-containing protein n=1 Tax=Leptolyngbya sp. FACHB-261 TaxID=2692806 RepID=UPI0016871DA1|nr:DUF4351 domain-containing protein [Leptolyngbya sp. FACHB-261]MBD2099501.1 DUF4351 domain-containing protein [Leptolyngbya sp. FACHB-261]